MGDKLREEIESILRDAEYMAHCGKDIESLLQRCLESLRWIPVEERLPPEGEEVQVKIKDSNPLTGEPDTHYSHDALEDGVWYSEAEYEEMACTIAMPSGTHYTWPKVIAWLPIPQ